MGTAGVWFGVERWPWFRRLPRFADARLCGNCFLASVGVPSEIGLLGLLLVAVLALRVRPNGTDILWWCCALVGVLLTPFIIGVPVFTYSFIALVWPSVKSGLVKGGLFVLRCRCGGE